MKKSPVVQRSDQGMFSAHVLSEPFTKSSPHDTRNAIVAYTCPSLSNAKRVICDTNHLEEGWIIECIEMSLIDVQGYCDSVGMPLMVILSERCDMDTRQEHADVFFYERKLRDDDTSKAWWRKINKK